MKHLAALCCVLIAGSTLAQKLTPMERAQHIAEVNAIDTEGMKPWHLKLDYQLMDSKGKLEKHGTIEKWWASPEHWRLVQTEDGKPLTILKIGDDTYRSDPAGFLSSRLEILLHQIEHPVSLDAAKQSAPTMEPRSFGRIKTDCVMLGDPIKGVQQPPFGLFPTYCVGSDDMIRLSWIYGHLILANDQTGTFQNHRVPVKVHAVEDQVDSFRGDVQALGTVEPTVVNLAADDLIKDSIDHPSRIGSGVMQGMKLGGAAPYYPVEARSKHISGTVILRAVIGKDGYIHSLHVASSPDGSLSVSALAAVRSWQYKPYLLNGIPTEVDTTITVNYNLN